MDRFNAKQLPLRCDQPTRVNPVTTAVAKAYLIGISAFCLGACAAAAAPKPAEVVATNGDAGQAVAGPLEGLALRPRDAAPAKLDGKDKKTLGQVCAPIENVLYEAGKAAVARLEQGLEEGDAKAEAKGEEAGLARLDAPQEGMSAADHQRCVAVFRKQIKRRLFDHEPAEKEARAFVTACVRRVDASFGKASMAYDMGGSGSQPVNYGPFCPDDLPIPALLKDLPYKSNKDDWDSPAWRCLTFGLRTKQSVQVEYLSERGSDRFDCIARFVSRHGGPPQEIFRRGKLNKEGELLIEKKSRRRDMKLP